MKTTRKEDIGKLFLDVGKLVFTVIFLGSILLGVTRNVTIAVVGLIVAIALFFTGILLVTKEKKNGNSCLPEKE